MRGTLPWLGLAVAVVALDQWTKHLAIQGLRLHMPVELLPFLSLTLAHNTGAAFSFLSDAQGWQRWFFTGLGLLVSTAIVLWLGRLPRAARWQACALALILGGALGNVWDRIQLGYVIDFIDAHVGGSHWPAFNIADSSITIGAVMLIIDAFALRKAPG